MRAVAFALACAVSAAAAFAADSGYVVAAAAGGIWETSIAVSPADANRAVVAGIVGPGGSVDTFCTDDGNRTWHHGGALSLDTPSRTFRRIGDPVVAAGRDDTFYLSTLIGYPSSYPLTYGGVAVYRSADGGRTWDGPSLIVSRGPGDNPHYTDDKEWISVDTTGSRYDGTIYVSWLRADWNDPFNQKKNEAVFSRSTDGGRTWSPEVVLGAGGGGQISIGPDGELYVLRTCGDGYYCSQVSRDGGTTFDAPVRMARSSTFVSNAVDTSHSPYRGNVYMAWIASIAGPQLSRSSVGTVYLTRSTDGGRSWETPVAITPAGAGTALFQTLACDPVTGDVVLTWLDRRANPTGTKFRLYMTRSTNGGTNFSEHVPITDPIELATDGFIGDYNQTSAWNGTFLSSFSDFEGHVNVAKTYFEPPPPPGPRRRAAKH